MPRRTSFRSQLRGGAFHTADALSHGLTPGQLRSSQLKAPFRGVRTLGVDADNVYDLCLSYEPLLAPKQVFCSLTAAILLGLPVPLAQHSDKRLHIGSLAGQGPRRRGVVGHRLRSDTPIALAARGLLVTDAASTWCQIAGVLGREDLTAVGDCIVSGVRMRRGGRSEPLATIEQLRNAVALHGRRDGAPVLRWALERVREKVDSPQETLLRLLLVEEGFAEPVIALPVLVEDGQLTLHPDLAWPELRVAIEYEGDGHREDRQRFRSDIRRREMFEAAGWRVMRVTADDLGREREAFVRRARRVVTARRAEFGL